MTETREKKLEETIAELNQKRKTKKREEDEVSRYTRVTKDSNTESIRDRSLFKCQGGD